MYNKLKTIFEVPGTGSRFLAMEGVRAFAVIAIFFVHFISNTSVKLYHLDFDNVLFSEIADPFIKLQYILFSSHWAVDVFFLLSGFLIFKIITKEPFNFYRFIVNRFSRIYPAFAASTVIVILYAIYLGKFHFELGQFLANLVFLNGVKELKVEPYSVVTWSLFFEFSFYLTFPLFILLFKQLSIPITRNLIITLGGLVAVVLFSVNPFYIRFVMFFAGVYMAMSSTEQLKNVSKLISDASVIMLFFLSILIFTFTLQFKYFMPVFIFTCYFFVVKSVWGGGVLNRTFSLTLMRYLGNISYSFYLFHGICISFLIWRVGYLFNWTLKIPYFGNLIYLASTFTACFLLSILVATISFILFEKPYFNKKIGTQQMYSLPLTSKVE
jgi:peptidoglycan/LPS O-acetylase OafA/YrhL